jgi:HD-GYP domain-containing protein (c-di-GMP phosphodiesterase class II)
MGRVVGYDDDLMPSAIPPPIPIEVQLRALHDRVREELPGIARLAIATYDAHSDALRTFVSSTDGDDPLRHHEAKLADTPSLQALAESRRDRVVDDVSMFSAPTRHSVAITSHYGSSYTRPLFERDRLRGFIFFDAVDKGFFGPGVVQRAGLYAELMTALLSNSLLPAKILRSAVRAAAELSLSRDPQTGAHLDRMQRYAQCVALGLKHPDLSDAFIEHLFVFAPLHDVGKVAIPDSVLLKPSPLDADELRVMRSQVTRGAKMVERLLEGLGLEQLEHVAILRNVVLRHHELWNGTGYPDGLAGKEIPIEARIVTVADVYDALTSARHYKAPWPPERALEYLGTNAGVLFDPECVAALLAAREKLEAIRQHFADEPGAVRLREGYDAEL